MNAKKTILVVEDVAVNRKILTRILKANNYRAIEAENGKIALDMLTREKNDISLVLLDITMPVMNGYELLGKMKELNLLNSIPVIVTTGSEQNNEEVRSLECGATDFIPKPYNADVVLHRVKSILRLCENAALINHLEIDRLTGVYSREFFYRNVEELLDKNPDEKYDIVCCNIENFKLVNSKYGIEVGDELLKCVAGHCAECVKDEGVCGRLGSDTFAVLRKRREVRSQDEIGQRILNTFVDAPIKNFVIQYGIFQVEDRTITAPVMCDRALLALTSIKHKYGVHYAVYNDSMRQRIERDHLLSNYMVQALEEKQFIVYLQPKHNIETGEIAGAEALVRWIHPELGFISPGEFISLFERNGFITKLDRYIWEEVCHILNRWMESGRKLIPISVNASRADFTYNDLPEYIGELADSHNIPHEMLHFEITESAYTDNPHQIISAVSTLRDMGFLIEMDDFGSGYSSLNMLSELPIDILKLDMRFVQNENHDMPNSKKSILSFIVGLSKWLQYPTIAEGVETEDEVNLLRTMGCNYIQGYYYAKPMPVDEFEKYMSEHKNSESNSETGRKTLSESDTDSKNKQDKPSVMIAEDIESNRELLIAILSPKYNVIAVENGDEAYRYLAGHRGEISCLLLDLLMPVIDGFQLLELLRKDQILEELPVIITSEAGSDSELRALHLGAEFFVAKPYNGELLLHYVEKAVNEHELRLLKTAKV